MPALHKPLVRRDLPLLHETAAGVNESDKATLATIEALLVNDLANPREALEAAYQLGRLSGGIEMVRVGQGALEELRKEAA